MLFQFSYRTILMSKIEGNEDFSESQEEFLQPITKFSPPNQIITKVYSPDEKPILKLMRLDKSDHGTCQELKKRYRSMFEVEDTLGYQYSYSLSNQIVYLKFNNQNYFKYKIKNLTYKFLAGLFIPVERLLSPEVKLSKNIYKVLQDLQFTEYKINIEESFNKNSRYINPKTLRFSSNYESGNLFIAMKKKQFQYDLILQNDINSKGNTQWFNFAVQFRHEGTYRFNILNFTKSYSQYEDGMRIVYYSFKQQEAGFSGWNRGCLNIKYEESSVKREDECNKNYSCLSFEYCTTYPTDKVIFAYFYPYTSIELQKFFKRTLYRKINVHMKMQKIKICETISGLPIYVISIQHKKSHKPEPLSFNSANSKNNSVQNVSQNKSVVFLARQHSGESQGSFIVEGIIQILMENGQIDYLKKNVDFYIFPMVNADGVFYGNYRTNLSGTDLNRIWRSPKKQLHPEVYFIKKYLCMINKDSPISLIVDVHGHSKSLNSFFYGNPPKKDLISSNLDDSRLFPYICSRKIKQVSFLQSTFTITEDKKNSARVVLSQMFPRSHVYTLENSFHGWRKDHNTIHEYTPEILKKIGRQLIIAYLQYDKLCEKNPQIRQKWLKQISELKNKNSPKEVNESERGQSDSEAEFQLIQIQQNSNKASLFDFSSQDKSIFTQKSELINSLSRENRQNFIARNLMIKTQVSQNRVYNRYHRKLVTQQESISIKQRRSQKQLKIENPSSNQGFLSIIKIKTVNEGQDSKKTAENESDKRQRRSHDIQFSKQTIIEKLKRKKIKIEQAVNSNSGLKTFFKTMGIPIEKKLL